MKIKFKKKNPDAKIPERQTTYAAGYDMFAVLEHDIHLHPSQVVAIPTGLAVSIEDGYQLSIRPRSGMAYKKSVTLVNSPATIDSDYRGEIKIPLINLGGDVVVIKNGERIAQCMAERVYDIEWIEGDLDVTHRGEGGFGSTGG